MGNKGSTPNLRVAEKKMGVHRQVSRGHQTERVQEGE